MPCEVEDVWQSIFNKINPIHNPKIVLLEPGLELDKLIARQVLGWRERSQEIRRVKNDKGFYDRSLWWDSNSSGSVHLNHFSTDIKAAWDLAEKFRMVIRPFGETGWAASKKWCDDEMVLYHHSAKTAPHAICLAALFYANKDNE